MVTRRLLIVLASLLLLTWGVVYLLENSALHENRKKPNIILIVVDALRKDHLGCYGYPRNTSTNIDRLAENGIKYTRCFSQAPWTTPSISSLLSSRYPSELEIKDIGNRLKDEFVLLPEVLKRQGYRTGAVISHAFLGSQWNFDQGFDDFNEDNIFRRYGISSPGVTQRAIEFIDKNRDKENRDKPFFLFLHYFDPHYNFHQHEEYDFSGATEYHGPVSAGMDLFVLRRQRKNLTEEDIERLISFYDSEIAFTDYHIGMVLDRLKQLELYENSLIIFTADHGEEFMERGWLGHTKTLYSEVTNVPLIIRYPGVEEGRTSKEPVGLIDLYPTLMDYLDISPATRLSGHSILGRDLAGEAANLPVYSETSRLTELRSVVQNNIKLIYNVKSSRYHLYDLEEDPLEETDLFKKRRLDYKQVYTTLKTQLEKWTAQVQKSQSGPENTVISDELKKHLESLGY